MAHSGLVKSWVAEKGCGFLAGPEGEDVFVHTSALGGGKLTEGATVSFDVVTTRDGKKTATNVSGPGLVGGKAAIKPGGKLGMMMANMQASGLHPSPLTVKSLKPTYMGRGTGVVRMFNEDKGFGFTVQDGGGPDLFFHRKDLPKLLPCPHCSEPIPIPCKPAGPPGHGAIDLPPPTLIKGGKVTFTIEMQPDGKLQAIDIQGEGVGAPRSGSEDAAGMEDMSLYECESCRTQFLATPGSVVRCSGCAIEIQL
eukprot:TRINITY_DN1649_c0_g2_i1.p1 TRINITY_DN1649_c0_g2~~TRINITY_DN1649_c0_g2_i1.p1  ORF type:complete len:253 (+),score=82.10 TRINITY_DN1649_c0_g2_i1:102-860(+)